MFDSNLSDHLWFNGLEHTMTSIDINRDKDYPLSGAYDLIFYFNTNYGGFGEKQITAEELIALRGAGREETQSIKNNYSVSYYLGTFEGKDLYMFVNKKFGTGGLKAG